MIAFWILAICLIASGVFVVTARKPVYSVVGLLANFAVLATLYYTLSAEFLAVIQLIVYSGAILILFVFVIALLSSGVAPFSVGPDRMPKALVPAVVLALAAVGFLTAAILHGTGAVIPARVANAALGRVGEAGVFGSVADFGNALFRTHLLAFEITAFILLIAIIGVVALAGDIGTARPSRPEKAERAMREAILRGGEQ